MTDIGEGAQTTLRSHHRRTPDIPMHKSATQCICEVNFVEGCRRPPGRPGRPTRRPKRPQDISRSAQEVPRDPRQPNPSRARCVSIVVLFLSLTPLCCLVPLSSSSSRIAYRHHFHPITVNSPFLPTHLCCARLCRAIVVFGFLAVRPQMDSGMLRRPKKGPRISPDGRSEPLESS